VVPDCAPRSIPSSCFHRRRRRCAAPYPGSFGSKHTDSLPYRPQSRSRHTLPPAEPIVHVRPARGCRLPSCCSSRRTQSSRLPDRHESRHR
jgi:hypothetical protein